MNNPDRKRKLVGPWRNLHGAVWLIGLAILAWKGWWWPGILVLIAASTLLEGAIMAFAPTSFVEEAAPLAAPDMAQPLPPVAAPAPVAPPEHRLELLPATCPNCGGPIRGKDVKWTGPQSADCPYCGANLPMQPGQAQPQPH